MDENGSLSDSEIQSLIRGTSILSTHTISEAQIQPASLDVTLAETAWAIPASFLPEKSTVEKHIRDTLNQPDTNAYPIKLSENNYTLLQSDTVYVVKLRERLSLPKGIRAKANPKSSIGRLDVFTRLIVDYAKKFDDIPERHEGNLYIEIIPTSFPIFVKAGCSLNQLRFLAGTEDLDTIDLLELYHEIPLLYDRKGKAIPAKEAPIEEGGLFMSVNLESKIVAFTPKKTVSTGIRIDSSKRYNPKEFWDAHYRNRDRTLTFQTMEFYIISTNERIIIPQGYTATMVPYEAATGEFRTQYAGFFDTGFGLTTGKGMPATMEIRHFGKPHQIRHGQRICKLTFQKLRKPSSRLYGKGAHYTKLHNGPGLGRHFREWKE